MDIETMKTFLVLVDTKNFTRTAHQLFYRAVDGDKPHFGIGKGVKCNFI